MGRKKIYENNAEKLRVWRAKKKLKKNRLGVYPSYNPIRLDKDTREKIETLNPELLKRRYIKKTTIDKHVESMIKEHGPIVSEGRGSIPGEGTVHQLEYEDGYREDISDIQGSERFSI
jgi:hypothetical protein